MATVDRKKLLTQKKIDNIFKMIDKDRSGYLNVKELK